MENGGLQSYLRWPYPRYDLFIKVYNKFLGMSKVIFKVCEKLLMLQDQPLYKRENKKRNFCKK